MGSETGETSQRKVTATITGKGTKHLVDITLHTADPESEAETESGTNAAGGKGPAPTTLTATDGHPFWVPQLDTWIDAADLNTGQYLQTSAGTRIQITAITQRTTQATVHNLTVAGTHTCCVLAGATLVLVHNASSERCQLGVQQMDHVTSGTFDIQVDVVSFASGGRGSGGFVVDMGDRVPGTTSSNCHRVEMQAAAYVRRYGDCEHIGQAGSMAYIWVPWMNFCQLVQIASNVSSVAGTAPWRA
ncbi:polymorphic toxin-type HINT domain-containing protein [Streptomyces albidoflavus]